MQLITREIEEKIIKAIAEVTEEWDDLDWEDGSITLKTKLIADLGFASVDFIKLIVAIEEKFQQKFGFHDLLMQNGKYVDDLSVEQFVRFIEQKLKSEGKGNEVIDIIPQQSQEAKTRLIESEIEEFRRVIPTPKKGEYQSRKRNSRCIFVLSAPRSGSTLLRVILAGNPQLFVPPELHLLDYNNLAERKLALNNELNSHLLEGTIRAIMQLKNCDAVTAKKIMADCENQQLSPPEFYHLLQQELGEKILVDKTPTYGFHQDILKRAETYFEQPLYLHLVRHPYGMIRSFEDAKIDKLIPFMRESSFSRREIAELVWLITQQNILEFLATVEPQRHLCVRFEDLVQSPQTIVEKICDFLGINFSEEMLAIYQDKDSRMTDGVNDVSRYSGDLKFHLHQDINPDVAYGWQRFHSVDFLSDLSWEVAEFLGYEKEKN